MSSRTEMRWLRCGPRDFQLHELEYLNGRLISRTHNPLAETDRKGRINRATARLVHTAIQAAIQPVLNEKGLWD